MSKFGFTYTGGSAQTPLGDRTDHTRSPFVNWTVEGGQSVHQKLSTKFPVPDDVQQAAATVATWLEQYIEFCETHIGPIMASSLDQPTKDRVYDSFQNSLGMLTSVQTVLHVLAGGMQIDAFLDRRLASAMRAAQRDGAHDEADAVPLTEDDVNDLAR